LPLLASDTRSLVVDVALGHQGAGTAELLCASQAPQLGRYDGWNNRLTLQKGNVFA
jgi:hypothetical protein